MNLALELRLSDEFIVVTCKKLFISRKILTVVPVGNCAVLQEFSFQKMKFLKKWSSKLRKERKESIEDYVLVFVDGLDRDKVSGSFLAD